MRRLLLALTLAGSAAIAALPVVVEARVYHARDEALALAFPDAERIEPRDVVLTKEQHDRIEALAKVKLESDLATVYVGWKGGAPVAYAILDSHTVRTFQETLLIVITPSGEVAATHVLAFHEPEEYLPPERWMKKLEGRRLEEDLKVGRGVVAITGSTLSTNAVVAGIRRALAIWQVVVRDAPASPSGEAPPLGAPAAGK